MKLVKLYLLLLLIPVMNSSCKHGQNQNPTPVNSSSSDFFINSKVDGIDLNCNDIDIEHSSYTWCGYSTQTYKCTAYAICKGFNNVTLYPVFYGDTIFAKYAIQLNKKYKIYQSNTSSSGDSTFCSGNMGIQFMDSLNGKPYWSIADKDTTQSYVYYTEFKEAGHIKEGHMTYKVYIVSGKFKGKVKTAQEPFQIKSIEGDFRFNVKLSKWGDT